MIVIVGESGCGKSAVVDFLTKSGRYSGKYSKVVTYTTRPKRDYEVDGVDYHFITKEEFEDKRYGGFFVETNQYNGWFYGTPLEDFKDDEVLILTPSGLRQLKQKKKELNIMSVYINVSRRDRLIAILQRGDDVDEACRRSLSDVGMFDGIENEVDVRIDNGGYAVPIINVADIVHKEWSERNREDD